MRIGLVGCVKSKRAVSAPAEDLYTSSLFLGRRGYVERTCDEWFILSAKHGLVDRDTILDPYDATLKDAPSAERRRWSREILDALAQRLGYLGKHTFEIHAGSEYRDFGLRAGLVDAGASVEIPAEGLGQGKQLAFYASDNERPAQRSENPVPERGIGGGASRGSSTYAPLGDYLADLATGTVKLGFTEIEQILGRPLPNSARRHRPWWGNERSGNHSHARAWLGAGWRVDTVDLSAAWVRFIR